ncbi:uncharacterized protein PG986_002210 [Apiospora aurea]|uniref:Secreted protein n=1 Tax=Apiospora aurea TaxID=335848 RepID=A0ABR1QZ38_9PEZI
MSRHACIFCVGELVSLLLPLLLQSTEIARDLHVLVDRPDDSLPLLHHIAEELRHGPQSHLGDEACYLRGSVADKQASCILGRWLVAQDVSSSAPVLTGRDPDLLGGRYYVKQHHRETSLGKRAMLQGVLAVSVADGSK